MAHYKIGKVCLIFFKYVNRNLIASSLPLRSRRNGSLTVVGGESYKGTAPGRLKGLDLNTPFFLGSTPDLNLIQHQTRFSKGFVGCISRLIIGGVIQQISPAIVTKAVGLTECETCGTNPCENDAVCQETNSPKGFTCLCKPGFRGYMCEKTGSSCSVGICNAGRCKDTSKGYMCQCPFGTGGDTCENEIVIHQPGFNGQAFMTLPRPKQILRALILKFRFKPKALDDSIIAYCSQSNEGVGDFAAVIIKDSHLEFRFDTGSGAAILRSKKKLKRDKWYTVGISRKLRDGQMKIFEEDELIKGRSSGNTRGLNIRTPIYFGGYKSKSQFLSTYQINYFLHCILS